MREYAKKPENQSRTLDSNSKASRQASIDVILQRYKGRNMQRYTEGEELVQGKFDTVQHKEVDEDELLQGKFASDHTSEQEPMQRVEKPNNTGLPNYLKTGVESLSGYSMDDVRVHYNSPKPAQLQALAYAQGTDIHVAPGQEKHLPHEAWHVVQQKQGRVQPTVQMQGVSVNDDEGLEREADEIERSVVDCKQNDIDKDSPDKLSKISNNTIQRKLFVGATEITGTNVDSYLNKKNPFFGFIKQQLQQLIGSDNNYSFQDIEKFNHYVTSIRYLCKQQKKNSIPIEIRIGIPYRDDQFGQAILQDILQVRDSTGIQTIPIDGDILPEDIHALYISGGPFSPLDSLIDVSKPFSGKRQQSRIPMPDVASNENQKRTYRIPFSGKRQQSRIERHEREHKLINQAIIKGLPILGMCGGSWRLAQFFRAQLMLMNKTDQDVHAKGMLSLWNYRQYHDMTVPEGSITHKMMEMGKENKTKVSSVHWLQILFDETSPVKISAFCENVVEAYEAIGRLGFPILGMQSHMEYSSLVPKNHRGSFNPMFPEHLSFMMNFGRFAIYFRDSTRSIPKQLLSLIPDTDTMRRSFIQMVYMFVNLKLIELSTVPEIISRDISQSVVPISQKKALEISRKYIFTKGEGVDEALFISMVDFLNLQTLISPPPEGSTIHLVSGAGWGCYIRCVLAHFNQEGQYDSVITKVTQWNSTHTTEQIDLTLGVSIGSPQETRLRCLITEIVGQQYYVEATDVQSGQKDTSAKPEGKMVSLILTGAHFSLLRKQ